MKHIKNTLFVLLLCSLLQAFTTSVLAQLTVANRYEVPIKRQNEDDFEVISLRERGLILINLVEPWQYAKEKEFTFTYFNNQLEIFRERSFILPFIFTQNRISYIDQEKFLYFFVQDQSDLEVSIFRLNIFEGTGLVYKFIPPVKLKVNQYYAIEDICYIIGEYNGKPVVMGYNFLEQTPSILPTFYEGKEEVRLVQTDEEHKQIYFVINSSTQRRCNLIIKPYSQLIGMGSQLVFKERGQHTAREGLIYINEDRQKVALGTYSYNCNKVPQGIYSAQFENGTQQKISYTKFTDFGNFFSYQGEKVERRWQKRIEKKRKRGKELILNRKIDLNEQIYHHNNELVLMMEGYYNNNSDSYYNNRNFGRMNAANNLMYNTPYAYQRSFYPYQNTTGMSYQYNYAIVCGFDKKGKLLWDNSISVDKVERTQRDRVVQLGSLGDSLVLSYLKDNEIHSKSFYRYRTLKEETKQELKIVLSDYATAETNWSEYIHWYDNHFLLFGQQRMKTGQTTEGILGRKVFHLTKLSYEILEESSADAKIQKDNEADFKEPKDKKRKKEG